MQGGSGHCLCGAVRFAFDGAANWQAHCHCESCRRNCAAPFTSFLGVDHGKWRWTGTAPARYASSPGVTRHFCPTCGTPMAYESEVWPHEIHFYAATLDDPGAYEPTEHVNWNEHLPWLKLADGLPVRRKPRRLAPDEDTAPVLNLIRRAFAYMDGVVDPPSSVHQLTTDVIARQAEDGEVWVVEENGGPIACLFLTPRADHLYVGKVAVSEAYRRQGLAAQLVALTERRARERGLMRLELESRVELIANHKAFEALGFARTGARAHEGFDRPTSLTFAKVIA